MLECFLYKRAQPALDSVGVCSMEFSRAIFIGEKLVFEMRDWIIPIKSKSVLSFGRSA